MPTPSVKMGLALPSKPDDFSTQDLHDNWSKIDAAPGSFICTSGSRPSWGPAQVGRHISETDTGTSHRWTGTGWEPSTHQPGDVKYTARTAISAGWLHANGTIVNRAAEPALFAAIGTTYNTGGETSTQFRLPNLVNTFIIGASPGSPTKGIGKTGGSFGVTLILANLPVHDHYMSHNHGMSHTHRIDHDHPAVTSSIEDANHEHYASGNSGQHVTTFTSNGDGPITVYQGYAGGTVSGGPITLKSSSLTGNVTANHRHTVDIPPFVGTSGDASTGATTASSSSHTGTAGQGQGFDITPPFIALLPLIKT